MADEQAFRCHYEALGVERDADAATIKKAHRRLALKHHPDRNIGGGGDPDADEARAFRQVQQAYECLSDPSERKWYDEHREALLRGWSAHGDNEAVDMLFDVVPYMYAGRYSGYHDGDGGFFAVYGTVFRGIRANEQQGGKDFDMNDESFLSRCDFGTSDSSWEDVAAFYQAWESFSSKLSFAWSDAYDTQQAENRRVRRAMEEENRRARRNARRERNEDVLALVRFVKRRDPRVQARKRQQDEEQAARQKRQQQEAAARRVETKKAREQWRQQTEEEMAAAEEEDRLAGRIRLADLEDDYDYGGKKGKGKKKKKKRKQQQEEEQEDSKSASAEDEVDGDGDTVDTGSAEDEEGAPADANFPPAHEAPIEPEKESKEEEGEEDEAPEIWRCECCRKDFKSEGQMENHMKSKKHKLAWKMYEAKLAELEEQQLMDDFLDETNEGDG
jgi:DnaJ family protein A protein 5